MDDSRMPAGASENKVWYLRRSKLFEKIDEHVIDGCDDLFNVQIHPKKTMLFDVGDDARTVYLLKRGQVRLTRLTGDAKEITVAVLGPGDIFGEDVLFGGTTRTTIAVCLEESLVCMSRADRLFGLLASQPAVSLNIAKYIAEQRDAAMSMMEDIAYLNVADRIVRLFERLAGEHGRHTGDGVRIDVRLTHADIAALVGSSRETVSLEISRLVKTGRLGVEGKTYTLPAEPVRTTSRGS